MGWLPNLRNESLVTRTCCFVLLYLLVNAVFLPSPVESKKVAYHRSHLDGSITSSAAKSVSSVKADSFADSAAVDTMWILLSGYIVFFMQVGFSMVEAGTVRASNVINLLMKNTIDMSLGTVFYWAIGYALSFGSALNSTRNPVFGNTGFFLIGQGDSYANFVFQWGFAACTAAIVSGCVAERGKIHAYMIQSIMFFVIIYPPVVHMFWSDAGWLSPFSQDSWRVGDLGVFDFAGCGPVHMVGGLVGLTGTIVMKPRLTRFKKNGEVNPIRPHNQPLIMMGSCILYFAWFCFNSGSTLAVTGGLSNAAALAAVNTCVAAAGSAMTSLFISRWLDKKYILVRVLNSLLAGLVGITSGCAIVMPWAAFVIGVVSAIVFSFSSWVLLEKCKIDDPLDASPLHFIVGIWGLISPGLLADQDAVSLAYGAPAGHRTYGLFLGGHVIQLGMQVLGVVIVILWVGFWSTLMWIIIHKTIGARVNPDEEEAGLDIVHHGGPAYDIVEFESVISMKDTAATGNKQEAGANKNKKEAQWEE